MTKADSIKDFEFRVSKFEKVINIKFKNSDLLKEALTHRSSSKLIRQTNLNHNERLEFLGDAVLKIIVSDYLIKELPSSNEGKLTKIRAHIISDQFLVQLSNRLDIGSYMLFSYGEIQTGGKKRHSNVANAFEALLGAIYLDQGLQVAYDFFFSYFNKIPLALEEVDQNDYKSILQEFSQKQFKELPTYTLSKEEGPEHQKKFFVTVSLPNQEKSFEGVGHSKKIAEQDAAFIALKCLTP
jgi:ribonuclease III